MDDFPREYFCHRSLGAGKRRKRRAAANRFAQNSEIGFVAVVALRARGAETKPRDRLVRDHEHAVAVAQLANRRHQALHGFEAAGVAEHGFEHDGRDLPAELIDAPAQVLDVVPTRHNELVQNLRNHAFARVRARGILVVAPAGDRVRKTHETLVGPTVIVPLETQNQFPPGVGAREAKGRQHHLGRRIVEPHQLRRRDHLLQPLRYLDLEFTLRRPMRAELGLRTDDLRHAGGSVPVKQSSLPELEVEVVVAIDVPEIRAAAPRKIERHRRLHFADAAVHAGGDAVLGPLKELLGLGESVGHGENSAVSGPGRGSRFFRDRCGSRSALRGP